jgi:peptide/nickel transport system substrate-binding protein
MLAIGLLVLMMAGSAMASEDALEVYTVADTTGDWGFPSPYAHYSRGPGYIRMSFIFDTLLWKDDSRYIPALAKSWKMVGDDVYVFDLRRDVTWHDGEKFTADDVVFTVDYTEDHPYMWVDSAIIERAEKIDDYTVKLYLSDPYAPFLDQVAGTLPILPEHIYSDVDNPESFKDDEALIGTGPFTLDADDYNKAQGTYRYRAYDDYYQGAPKVKELRFTKVSEATAAAALSRGDVNAADIQPEMIDQLSGFTILTVPSHWWNYKLMINHQEAPTSDKRFRQALAYAIDRQDLVDIAGRGYGLIGSPGLIPSDNDWYNSEIEQYSHNLAKAKDLLDKAGYQGEEIELLVKGGRTTEERIGELITEDLKDAGINVNLRTLDSKTVDSKVKEWDFDLALSGHGGLIGDPNFLARNTVDMTSFNSARYDDNDELTEVLEDQMTETDEDDRKDLIDRAQVLYAEDVVAITLFYPDWFYAHDGQVDLYYTYNGIAMGVPIPLNKMAFV